MAAALGLAAPGVSADGPVYRGSIKGEPHLAPAYIWSGLYIGGSAAYGIGATELGLIEGDQVLPAFDFSLKGVQGVVSLGYDWQLSPRWVLGVFGDYAFGEIDGIAAGRVTSVIDQQWAIGGRLGLLATPSTLFYSSGGYTRANHELFDGNDRVSSKMLDGFFVGLGVEQAINRNWSLKIDYRFSAYEDFTRVIEEDELPFKFDNEVHSVRIGVNWRFGG